MSLQDGVGPDPMQVAAGSALPYSPTYSFPGAAIDDRHRELMSAPLIDDGPTIKDRIVGSLRRADAAKLYELSYFCEGDVLELGTNLGLSASILAEAKRAGGTGTIHTVDRSPGIVEQARTNLALVGASNVVVHCQDGTEWITDQINRGRKFGFAFVDHAHSYRAVRSVSALLDRVLLPGSYVAFHDFIDRRNFSQVGKIYGIPQGARDGLPSSFQFLGGCGCMGLYRFSGAPKALPFENLTRLLRRFYRR